MTQPAAKVFIVDDDEAVRDALKVLLESHGIPVDVFGSTADFAGDYKAGPNQCLILDQHMPQSTGLAFLASSEGATLRLPVVLLTGHGDNTIRARANELGVKAYLEKPVSGDTLLATIARVVAQSNAPARRSSRPM
jgi:FixJ family two-component response regulator